MTELALLGFVFFLFSAISESLREIQEWYSVKRKKYSGFLL
jgi:hypothetical protein